MCKRFYNSLVRMFFYHIKHKSIVSKNWIPIECNLLTKKIIYQIFSTYKRKNLLIYGCYTRARAHTHTHTHTHIYIYIYINCIKMYINCIKMCDTFLNLLMVDFCSNTNSILKQIINLLYNKEIFMHTIMRVEF